MRLSPVLVLVAAVIVLIVLGVVGALVLQPPRPLLANVSFSLNTITSTGYGDVIPLNPLARSLTNVESVIGQLFPATLIARLVGLHLSHRLRLTSHGKDDKGAESGREDE